MRACLALLAVTWASACSSGDLAIRIERQPTTLAKATTDGWVAGGAVLVAAPGSFSFPQPVALRITLVDPDAEMPEPGLVSRGKLTVFGDGVAEISENLTCQPTYCQAELTITAPGDAMLQAIATGKDNEGSDCFYYGVHEDADPAAASPAPYDAIEAKQRDCQRDLFD
jgi:hypothetical protein